MLDEHDGIAQYITGGGGAPLHGEPQDGAYFHYVLATVTGPVPATEDAPAQPVAVEISPVRVSDPVNAALENLIGGDLQNVSIFDANAANEVRRAGTDGGDCRLDS